jgi:hypothetical protein
MVIAIVWLALIVLAALVACMFVWRRLVRLRPAVGIAAALCFALAALLGYRESVRLEWYLATARWPAVAGKVISAEVVGKRAFVPKITYSYHVGDSVYTGVTDLGVPGFGTRNVRLDVAEKSVADYTPDAAITVHHDPTNPGISRLRVNVPWNVYVRLSTAVFGSLLSAAIFLVFLVGKRRSKIDKKRAATN